MKVLFQLSIFLFIVQQSVAQSSSMTSTTTVNYVDVDTYARSVKNKFKNIPDLSKAITAPFTTEEEKVRAIFIWITNNIAYDCAEFHKKNRTIGGSVYYSKNTPQSEIDSKWETVYFNYATRVMRNKKGICEGYATLFYELCKYSGINCEMVSGFADGNNALKVNVHKRVKVLSTNHAWNKVLINGKWFYLDVTWASGYCDSNCKKFTKHFNEEYYLVPENKLYQNHVVNAKKSFKRNSIIGNY